MKPFEEESINFKLKYLTLFPKAFRLNIWPVNDDVVA